jgi:uncharacterized damage-inducible protein DinB
MAKEHLLNASYYDKYIELISEDNVGAALANRGPAAAAFLQSVPQAKANHSYAPGKWTVKQLLQHLCDTERVFAYRALRFARRDATPLAGFEENDYAVAADVSRRSVADLAAEFMAVRHATEALFSAFSESELRQSGSANGHKISVASIAWVILGHFEHHKQVLLDRYL